LATHTLITRRVGSSFATVGRTRTTFSSRFSPTWRTTRPGTNGKQPVSGWLLTARRSSVGQASTAARVFIAVCWSTVRRTGERKAGKMVRMLLPNRIPPGAMWSWGVGVPTRAWRSMICNGMFWSTFRWGKTPPCSARWIGSRAAKPTPIRGM